MPQREKHSYVTPLLKKPGLDVNELSNYRPVSILPIVSKIIEQYVGKQLQQHFLKRPLSKHQFAYKPYHSTETALLHLISILRTNISRGLATAVVALDLSAAFDTIDINILLSRLKCRFGITGRALDWFTSYLRDRSFQVRTGGSVSPITAIDFGIAQGSGFGPTGFNIYMVPCADLIEETECDQIISAATTSS